MAIQDLMAGVSYPHVVLTSFTLAIAFVLSTAVYRLYFHPLAKVPGPFWARLTTIPSYLHTIKQDRHVWMLQLQEEYGTTFRYRPDAVVANTPTAQKEIFGPKGNIKKDDHFYRVWPHNINVTNTWNVTDVNAHARKRRVLGNAFSDKALRGSEQYVHSNTDRWLQIIRERIAKKESEWSESLNMANEVNYLVFDILGDLCFGKQFNMKEPESDLHYVPHLMASFMELLHPIAFSPFADWWVWAKPRGLDWLLTFAIPEDLKKWQAFVGKNLEERTKAEEDLKKSDKGESAARKDFFHYLFDAKDPQTGELGYDLDELYGECEVLTIAGSDTTAIVTAAMTFYLAKNPAIQSTLAREVLSAFQNYDDIAAGPDLHNCKYLTAFIKETLRMTPPVPAELAREVLPGGTTVEGNFYPADTKLSTCLYCLSYNPDVYAAPFTFDPSRWIVDEADPASVDRVALAESGACAFSMGVRGCVGKNMAWMEMRIVLAKLIYAFELRQKAGDNLGGGGKDLTPGRRELGQYQIYDAFVAMRNGPMVEFKQRTGV